jgi:hypothetical protein
MFKTYGGPRVVPVGVGIFLAPILGCVTVMAPLVTAIICFLAVTFVCLARLSKSNDSSVVLACIFLAAQPLTTFAIQSPAGTLTADNLVLVALAATRIPQWRVSTPTERLVSTLLCGWLLTYPLRVSYLSIHETLRTSITAASFVVIFMVARTLPTDWKSLRLYAWSASFALAIFGGTAILAAVGVLPMPHVEGHIGQRDLFGIVSPYPRNYGLNVAIDSIALLAAVATPMLVLCVLATRVGFFERSACLGALVLLGACELYLFQARGMLIQVLLSALLVAMVRYPILRFPAVAFLILGAVKIAPLISSVDQVSSSLRMANYFAVLNGFRENPMSFIFGRSENQMFIVSAQDVGWGEAISGEDNAIHNFFLGNLVGGGVIAFACIAGAYVIVSWKSASEALARRDLGSTYLFVALMICLFELMVEPARAQVVGNWFVLGLAVQSRRLSAGAGSRDKQDEVVGSARAPDDGRRPPPGTSVAGAESYLSAS